MKREQAPVSEMIIPGHRRRLLHAGWHVRLDGPGRDAPEALAGRLVPATVPGSVHTDLLAARLIPDPHVDRHELDVAWVGRNDWAYGTTFEWAPGAQAGSRVDLVFDGLDTVASIELNGTAIGTTANMHRTYRFEVGDRLLPGPNELLVRFASPLAHIEREWARLGPHPHGNVYPEHYNVIRKMACNFGWDWGPSLPTVGVWRPVALETWSIARLAAVRPHVAYRNGRGSVEVDVDLELDETAEGTDGPIRVVASVAGRTSVVSLEPGRRSVRLALDAGGVDPWWPHSHGAQPRYELTVEAWAATARLDTWQRLIGFRTITLDTSPDPIGRAWQLCVNGRPVWVRGANWIPDDTFPARVGADRYRQRVEQAVAANVDLLRVWGGGIYESDALLDACDELGVLVWQDFAFACATYPEDQGTWAEVEREARDNVTRLMSHPSLAIWNGNNECAWLAIDRGWLAQLEGRPWGDGYYQDLLPAVTAELDPGRPYWPGSPHSGSSDTYPNDQDRGNYHAWDVWNRLDYDAYRDHRPRFVSEFGFQGPPTWSTLRRALPSEELAPGSPGFVHHQKAGDGMAKLQRGLEAHFPIPADFDDWHFLAQVNQARAVALGVEHFRSLRDVCSGQIIWQLNDCWPVTSWSVVDGDGRRKPAWYALRRANGDHLLTIQPGPGGDLRVVLVNEADGPWIGQLRLARVDAAGQVLADWASPVEVGPRQAGEVWVPTAISTPGDPHGELVMGRLGDLAATWFWVPDRDFQYPVAALRATVEPRATGYAVSVAADSLARDICLLADRADPAAEADDMLLTLLPGESAVFEVTSPRLADPTVLTRRPVLRCVNDIPEVVRTRR